MIEIKLTRGKVTLIDDNFAHLSMFKWYCSQTNYAVRAFRKYGERSIMYLHHAIIGHPLNGLEVDHRNGNRLDNRLSNLRIVTRRQNHMNKSCHRGEKPKTSKYIGAYWSGKLNKWGSVIQVHGKSMHLGFHLKEEDASDAYQKALIIYG